MNTCTVGLRQYLSEATLHRHDHHQIVLPQVGDLELEVDGRGGHVKQGVGAFILAGATHAFLAKGRNGFVVVDLPVSESSSDPLAHSFEKGAFFPIEPALQGLLDYATATLERTAPAQSVSVRWVELLVERLVQNCGRETLTRPDPMDRAVAFMRRHAFKPIKVADISAAAGLSTTLFHTAFRRHYGQSPHAALVQWRVDAARRLLTGTDLPIAEIATCTGHADQSALTRRLKRALGVTPAALRRTGRSHCT